MTPLVRIWVAHGSPVYVFGVTVLIVLWVLKQLRGALGSGPWRVAPTAGAIWCWGWCGADDHLGRFGVVLWTVLCCG